MKVSIDFAPARELETGAVTQPESSISFARALRILQGITSAVEQMGKEIEDTIEVITVVPKWGNGVILKVVFAVGAGNVQLSEKKTKFEDSDSYWFLEAFPEDESFKSKLIDVVKRALSVKMADYHASRELLSCLLSRVRQSH